MRVNLYFHNINGVVSCVQSPLATNGRHSWVVTRHCHCKLKPTATTHPRVVAAATCSAVPASLPDRATVRIRPPVAGSGLPPARSTPDEEEHRRIAHNRPRSVGSTSPEAGSVASKDASPPEAPHLAPRLLLGLERSATVAARLGEECRRRC
jgi:hypothetical protein